MPEMTLVYKPLSLSSVWINKYVIPTKQDKKFKAQISIETGLVASDQCTITAMALIDSGCTTSCIDAGFVQANQIPVQPLEIPVKVINADGTENKSGGIRDMVTLTLKIHEHKERITLFITDLGKDEIFLGFDWLEKHNPEIDWKARTVTLSCCESIRAVKGLEMIPEEL